MNISLLCRLLVTVALAVLLVPRALAQPHTLSEPTAEPAQVLIGQPSKVRFSVDVSDTSVLGINLLRVGAPGTNPAIVATLRDDGTGGDEIAGDGRYSIEYTLNEPAATTVTFRLSAAFKGMLQRVQTPDIAVQVVANRAPVAIAGANQAVKVGRVVTLDGRQSFDLDGDLLGFRWQMTTRPTGSAAALDNASFVKPSFTADVAGTYQLQLIVNDGKVDSALSAVTVQAYAGNAPPTAVIGGAGPRTFGAATSAVVPLASAGSTDPEGSALSATWKLVRTPASSLAATFGALGSTTPTLNADKPGRYVVELQVSDGAASSAPVQATVTLYKPNTPPLVDAGADRTVAPTATVALLGSAQDADSGDTIATLRWAFIARPAGSNAQLLNPTTATPSFAADVLGDYLLELLATDSRGARGSARVLIRAQAPLDSDGDGVPDASDQCPNTPRGARVTAAGCAASQLPSIVISTLTANPANGNVPLAVQFGASASGGAGGFTYGWTFGDNQTSAQQNPLHTYGTAGDYTARVTATDVLGTTGSSSVTIHATTAVAGNKAPVVSAGTNQTITFPAGADLSGSASDDGLPNPPAALTTTWSKFSGPGTVTFGNANQLATTAVFSQAGTYVLRLTASDTALSNTSDVTITVNPGTLALDPVADLTAPTNTTVNLRLAGHSSDALAPLTYGLVNGPNGATVTTPGVFSFTPAQSQLGQQTVTVQVGDGSGKTAQQTFRVNVVDHDHAPVLGALADDSARVGANYTRTLTASDADAGDTLTFTLVSGPAGMTLSGATLSWTPTAAQLGNWPVQVRVTDRSGASDTGEFHVEVPFLTAKDDHYEVHLGATLNINAANGVLANDVDPFTTPLAATKLTNPDKGSVTAFNQDGSFAYQAPPTLPVAPFQPVVKMHFNNGANVANMPLVADLNGDGKAEFLARYGNFGFRAVSQDGTVLWDIPGALPAPHSDCSFATWFSNDSKWGMAIGDIDDDGKPEVIAGIFCGRDTANQPYGAGPRYVALDGATGRVKWLSPTLSALTISTAANFAQYDLASWSTPSIARLRPGESPSIVINVAPQYSYATVALAADGSPIYGPACMHIKESVPDGDYSVGGFPPHYERCKGLVILDGKNGSVRQRMIARGFPDQGMWDRNWNGPIVADLDGDGVQEIAVGGTIYNLDGSIRWQTLVEATSDVAVANFDDDPDLEIVRVRSNQRDAALVVSKVDGRELWRMPLGDQTTVGKMTIADIDNSGRPSILLNMWSTVCAFDYQGQWRWCYDTRVNGVEKLTGWNRHAVFDLDGDGVPEVIVSAMEKLLFLEGPTGKLKYAFDVTTIPGAPPPSTGNNSYETGGPVVTDVDGDGHADVFFTWVQNDYPAQTQFTILRAQNNDWQPARQIMNQLQYWGANVNDNGTIPQPPLANVFANPASNVFRNQARIATPPDPRKREQTSFTYRASGNGVQSAPATVTIDLFPANRPPKFTSVPPSRYTRFTPFAYTAHADDPDVGDTVTYSMDFYTYNGGSCSIHPTTGVLSCNEIQTTEALFLIRATDSQGDYTYQTVLMKLSPGAASVPNVVGLVESTARNAIEAAGFGNTDSNTVTNNAPKGQVISQSPSAGVSALLGETVKLTVSAGPPADATLAPPPALGNVVKLTITPATDKRVVGESVAFKATATSDDGTGADVTANVVWASKTPSVATINASGNASAVAAGSTSITATLNGLTTQATLQVVARTAGDQVKPVAAIMQPADTASVTGPTQIVGTASDANFVRYELALAPADGTTYTVIGRGTSAVTNGNLGTFDPTLLINGAYKLRLTVYDAGGNSTTAENVVIVDGQQKIGVFTLSFRDLRVPLAGIPIEIVRTYDSRDKTTGDFGVGWRLSINTFRASTSRPLGTKWQVVKQGLSYGLVPGADHIVTITLPGGRVEKFDMRLSPTVSPLVPFTSLVADFVPLPGTVGKLQSVDNNNLLILDNQPGPVDLVDDATLNTYHPDRFLYTGLDGTKTVVTRTHGVESVEDRNGNKLTIGSSGITHTSGASVSFVRDTNGRITRITDPSGQTQTYAYNALGDLVSHTDANRAVTKYFYNAQHGLVRIEDPLGRPVQRTEYDDAGRVVAFTSADGKTTSVQHDITGRQEVITDALGRTTVLSYDDRGNVVTLTNALGETTTYTYDAMDNETSRTGPDRVKITTTYTGVLPAVRVIDAGGLNITTTYAYNAANDPTSVLDALGRQYTLAYDAKRNVTRVATPASGAVNGTTNAQGQALTVTDALGVTTSYTYDSRGNVIQEEVRDAASALLRRIAYTYDQNGNPLTETIYRTVNGSLTPFTTAYAYDATGRVTAVTDPLGNITRYQYDIAGQRTAVTDALGRRTSFTYDVAGRVTRTDYPDGTFTTATYDAVGNLLTETDAAGRTTSYEYDGLNRPTRTILPDGTSRRTLYDAAGNVSAAIDAKGNRTDYVYDAAGRRTGTLLPAVPNGIAGTLTRPQLATVLNVGGLPQRSTDPLGRQTTYQFDSSGRLNQVTFPDGSSVRQTYDALGRRTAAINEENQSTSFAYDGLGRLVGVTGLRGDASYRYDEAGNVIAQTDALGRVTRFKYDALGRLVERQYPGGEKETYAYDAVGNLTSITNPDGSTVTATYDAMNRPIRKDVGNGVAITYAYRPDGQRSSASGPGGTTNYEYDALGRVGKVVHATGEAVTYGRDANGNLTSLQAPAGTTTYAYDALDRMLQVSAPEGSHRYFYDLAGNRVRTAFANGVNTDYAYDLRDRLTSIVHQAGGGTLKSFTNAYSPAGRRTSTTESGGTQVTFGYDNKGRLVSEARTGSTPFTISHAYDAVGNRTATVQNGASTAFTYNSNDQLVSDGTGTYTYDANGNLTARTVAGVTTRYVYDRENRLVSVVDPSGTTQFAYDADGNRIQAVTPSGSTRFLVDLENATALGQVLEERDTSNALQARYTYGDELLAMQRSGASSYYQRDVLGSVRLLTGAGAAVTDSYVYDAFGRTITSSGATINPYQYAGERLDPTGLYHLRARYYDPARARFLSRDPFSGYQDDAPSLHRYAYVANDPVNAIDPTGLEEVTLHGQVVAQGVAATTFAGFVSEVVSSVCTIKAVVEEVNTLVFFGDMSLLAFNMLTAYYDQHKSNGRPGVKWKEGSATKNEFRYNKEWKNAPPGGLKKLSFGEVSSGGKSGVKLGLEFVGFGKLDEKKSASTLDFEVTTPPPAFKGAWGGKYAWKKDISACGVVSLGEVAIEANVKNYTKNFNALGASAEIAAKLSLFNKQYVATYPLLGIDAWVGGLQKGGLTWTLFNHAKGFEFDDPRKKHH